LVLDTEYCLGNFLKELVQIHLQIGGIIERILEEDSFAPPVSPLTNPLLNPF
jgi:hypothetical protein|tara:strand:- start:3829 stop:3984 length:156 start_codon:yes stop_codon:yes gene_type:complete